ncbi:DJ-1/PfpI family protein [Xenophilus arseniciresistens]|uniref:DJ-1/PfpI family protein n=1 Tax=Xenophilus arseniciresistens TaxID=1283306 RepID=A0AAE3N4H7_9BURK|nr:DJ-1/PfpI family protein [Xenophilus arseniciresistens]MDA7414738.1 DJ-1/PfpI family protein [Xenophilus arseniciresistens]
MTHERSLQVSILVFDDVEALDFAGPYEVFTTASRVQARRAPGQPPAFAVSLVAQSLAPVRARAGLRVLPDHVLDDTPPTDLLLIPGGVVDAARQSRPLLDWIARLHAGTRLTASVCTGAFLLADAGVLPAGPCTTHWEDVADLQAQFPPLQVQQDPRWVAQPARRLYTSAGISAGLDLSLHLVGQLISLELAQATARQMDYHWQAD